MSLTWRKSTHSQDTGGACVEVGTWRKSTYSGDTGGNCVEVGTWRKSTHSGAQAGTSCVEVASAGAVLIRDTTDRGGFALGVDPAAWTAFLATVR